LCDLGWTILQICSNDYLFDPAGTIEATDTAMRRCLEGERTQAKQKRNPLKKKHLAMKFS